MTSTPAFTLPRHLHDAIIDHALSGAPEEVCGILSGLGSTATGLVRARNEAENPMTEYWVDGQTLLQQFDFEERGEAMIAIYHSHPADEAYPSATDAANAYYPDAIYLICSLQRPQQPVIRAWRLLSGKLCQRPANARPVRNNPRLLAHHHHDDANDHYDLVIVEDDGRERWVRVQVVEQEILLTG